MKKLVKVILIILLVVTFIAALIGMYELGIDRGRKRAKEYYKAQIIEETLEENPIPKCDYENCPKYQGFDVDGDGKYESVVTEYFGMTQFAGRVMVIDDGKVTFISKGEMFIGVMPAQKHDQTNGFIIYYSKVPNASSNDDIVWDHYKYINDKYVLEKTTRSGEY